jgi:hypothetical protein
MRRLGLVVLILALAATSHAQVTCVGGGCVGSSGSIGAATGTSLLLNGASAGTANVLGIQNTTALGSGVLDYASIRVQTAPASEAANAVGFGIYSTYTNNSSTTGTTGHNVAIMGNVTDTSSGAITMYGVEGRADGRSTVGGATHSYMGGTLRGFFQGASLSNSALVIGAEAFGNVTTDGSTPLASGWNVGLYLPALVGGAAGQKYAAYAAADPLFFGAGFDVGNADTTLTRSAAGWIAVEGNLLVKGNTQQITIAGPTAARTYTFPDATATMVSTAATQTLSSKTVVTPTISGSGNPITYLTFTDGGANRLLLSDSTGDATTFKWASATAMTFLGSIGIHSASYIYGSEATAPSAPSADGFRLYAQDNGGGKTQLCALFSSGAAQCFATQP